MFLRLHPSKNTPSIIKEALEKVTNKMIDIWSNEKIGTTIQAQRKELYSLKRTEQK